MPNRLNILAMAALAGTLLSGCANNKWKYQRPHGELKGSDISHLAVEKVPNYQTLTEQRRMPQSLISHDYTTYVRTVLTITEQARRDTDNHTCSVFEDAKSRTITRIGSFRNDKAVGSYTEVYKNGALFSFRESVTVVAPIGGDPAAVTVEKSFENGKHRVNVNGTIGNIYFSEEYQDGKQMRAHSYTTGIRLSVAQKAGAFFIGS